MIMLIHTLSKLFRPEIFRDNGGPSAVLQCEPKNVQQIIL